MHPPLGTFHVVSRARQTTERSATQALVRHDAGRFRQTSVVKSVRPSYDRNVAWQRCGSRQACARIRRSVQAGRARHGPILDLRSWISHATNRLHFVLWLVSRRVCCTFCCHEHAVCFGMRYAIGTLGKTGSESCRFRVPSERADMMALGLQTLLILSAIAIAYGVVANRMMKAAQPLRLEGHDAAMEMLETACLHDDDHDALRFMVGNLFNGFLPWILVLAFPFVAMYEVFHVWRTGRPFSGCRTRDTTLRARFEETTNRLAMAIFSQSPLASILFLIELSIAIVCLATLWPVAIVFRDVGRVHAWLRTVTFRGSPLRRS